MYPKIQVRKEGDRYQIELVSEKEIREQTAAILIAFLHKHEKSENRQITKLSGLTSMTYEKMR